MRSVCVLCEIPEKFHKYFPADRKNDVTKPHVTVLYVGTSTDEELDQVIKICQSFAAQFAPIKCKFGKINTFTEGDEGDEDVSHYVEIEAGPELNALHHLIWGSLSKAGISVEHGFSFKPHATLQYLPKGKKYNGPKPPNEEFELDKLTISVWEPKDGKESN